MNEREANRSSLLILVQTNGVRTTENYMPPRRVRVSLPITRNCALI